MGRVIVVGGGLAGCMAALSARSAGAETRLLFRAPGATALTIPPLRVAGDVSRLDSDHPLARLGLDAFALASELDAACADLVAVCGRAGLDLEGSWRREVSFADVRGRPRSGHLYPPAMAAGELAGLRGRRVAVAGLGAGEYSAAATASALTELAGARAEAFEADLALPAGAALSDLFGRPAPRPPGRPELVAYPPGLTDLPGNGFELAGSGATPFSLSFHRALHAGVAGAGVETLRREAAALVIEEGQLTGVRDGDGEVHPADSVVLAGGRFIGGGLAHERRARETLAGLPLRFRGTPLEEARRLAHLEYLDPEPAFEVGLVTDTRLRPLDSEDRPVHPNLHAAGSILAGHAHDPAWDLGVPLLTGRLAGIAAARSR